MAEMSPGIAVIGAGALGLAVSAELALRGHLVTVIDPGGGNASSVAAGMLAPASEAWLEFEASKGTVDRAPLFLRARDHFADLAERVGVDIHRRGAVWAGRHPEAVIDYWTSRGFAPSDGAITQADWQIAPVQALADLGAVGGVTRLQARVTVVSPRGDGWDVECDAVGPIRVRQVVVATGAMGQVHAPLSVSEIMSRITPIRGQLGFVPGLTVDRVVRAEGIYIAPVADGAVIGATMDVGRTDLDLDLQQAAVLVDRAHQVLGHALPDTIDWRVGIRGASADGLPLAGKVTQGLHVALAPRRNGWLMCGLIAQTVADAIEDRAPGADAAILDPLRLSPAAG